MSSPYCLHLDFWETENLIGGKSDRICNLFLKTKGVKIVNIFFDDIHNILKQFYAKLFANKNSIYK